MSNKLGKEEWSRERMMEAVDGATPDSNESTVPPKNNPGRTFRDGVRKIDLVLVMKDEENLIADPMKKNFLTNIVKTGLEIEFENGVLPIHKKLVFFKVHCPNDVLNNLGKAFGVKCVQIARAEHIMSNKERDWINLIRKEYTQPLQYSSLERSLVVYMTLLNVPFGDRQNYIGLERLMKRNIVVEAYALHDGPYFITQDATSINARQILFYNWVGITNIFTKQPLNVVHEYFGPKVALYFAYYGLYNLFLAIASLAALITFFLAIFFNENYMDLRAPICEGQTVDICFQCYDKSPDVVRCYFVPVFFFCDWYKINVLMDNKYAPYFATLIVLWGIFFTAYWFGREKYFNWIWETRNKNFNRNQIRPEFDLNLDTARKSNKTGIVIGIHRGSKIKTLLWYIPVILLDAFVLFVFGSRKTLHSYYANALMVRLMFMMTVFVAVLLIIDFIHRKIASYIVRMENHRTYISYNRSLTKHQYIMCFSLPMIVLACYGFHKAIFEFQFWRGYKMDDKFLLDETCVLTSCINELAIAFTIVLLLRFVILRKLSRYSSTTDYNQRAIVQNVPCWEREFVLPRLKESILANKMMMLVIQLTFIIAFGFSCTPTIIFVLFFNIYNMRRDAELFTLHYRRPLFLKNKSFSIWSEILKLMVYLAIFVNVKIFISKNLHKAHFDGENFPLVFVFLSQVVSLVCSTDTIEAYLREQRKPTGNTLNQYLNLYFHNISKVAFDQCYARAYIHISKDIDIKREELTVDELKTYQYMYIFIFEIIMASLFLLMQYIFSIDVDEKEIPKKQEQENYEESRSNFAT